MLKKSKEEITEDLTASQMYNQSLVMESSSLCKTLQDANLSVEDKKAVLTQLVIDQKTNQRIKRELRNPPLVVTPEWLTSLKEVHENIRKEVTIETHQEG